MLFQVCVAGGAAAAGLLYHLPDLKEWWRGASNNDDVADVDTPVDGQRSTTETLEANVETPTPVRSTSSVLKECSSNIQCGSALKKSNQQRTKRVHWQRTLGNSQEQLISSLE